MKTNFRVFISSNYKKMKQIVQRNCWKRGMNFNEDIYNDVILKCLQVAPEGIDYSGYIITAYNNAYWNKLKKPIPDELSTVNELAVKDTDSIDLDIIYKKIHNKFGPILLSLFKKWLSGWSVREIEELSGKDKLTYQFKKIKDCMETEFAMELA